MDITTVCLKIGNKYHADYVNKLANMVRRNSRLHIPRFVCITDDPTGVYETTIPAIRHDYLSGWWHKVALFGGYKFDTERLVYFDLDTIIVDNIDFIYEYDGDFAILEDFYYPKRQGSAVLSIKKGYGGEIWDKFVLNPMLALQSGPGDQDWIERANSRHADRWQHRFPGKFVSYKVHCQSGIPAGAAVVCFHGRPKNEDVTDTWWVKEHWR